MRAILRLFFDLCLLRKGPQDIPYSPSLLGVVLMAYGLVAFLALSPSGNHLLSVVEVLVEMGVTTGFVWGVLLLAKKPRRFNQTLNAFLGTDALISLVALPALDAANSEDMGVAAVALLLLLMLWHWVVCGHILRHALNQPFIFSLCLAFLFNTSFYQLMNSLFPVAGL